MIKCAHCGRPNDPGSRFCMDCGKPLSASAMSVGPVQTGSAAPATRVYAAPGAKTGAAATAGPTCSKCGHPVDATMPFCAFCGAKLAPAPAAAAAAKPAAPAAEEDIESAEVEDEDDESVIEDTSDLGEDDDDVEVVVDDDT